MTDISNREVYEVGQFYSVPCVWTSRGDGDAQRWWPVVGNWHEDGELIGFPIHHFHVDTRFLAPRHKTAERRRESLVNTVRWPLQRSKIYNECGDLVPDPDQSAPEIVYRRMKCQRAEFTILEGGRNGKLPQWMRKLEDHFDGVELKQPICPHQGAPLNGPTDETGCVTCPLHGLRFCVSTGRLVRRTSESPAADIRRCRKAEAGRKP